MPQWYVEVGFKMIYTQMIACVVPWITVFMAFFVPFVKKLLDTKCSLRPFPTKKTGTAAFTSLYSGPDYIIHFKYSGVVNVVYVTMMYGVGMPILFPIAAVNLFTQWICERITLAHIVVLPPALDQKLTVNAISLLKWAPMLLLFNGYWMISNKQIFNNTWEFKDNAFDSMKSEHFVFWGVNWSSPLLLISLASVVL